jgi:enamine deaminase RidA (YjgF/YER057c/UK114 family)
LLQRTFSWPPGHWNWPIPVSHKHGVRCGPMIFFGGQVDLDPAGRVRHPNDLAAQIEAVMAGIGRVLAEFGAGPADLVKLQTYYVSESGADEFALLSAIGRHLQASGGLVVTAVPVPWLAYPGMLVEIEGVAMLSAEGRHSPRHAMNLAHGVRLPPPFVHGIRCGEMIFVSAQFAAASDGAVLDPGDLTRQSAIAMDRIGDVLAAFGAGHDDVVKINTFYVGGGTEADWEGAARVRARYFREPGPAATGIPLPRHAMPGLMTKTDAMAMLGEDGRHLPRAHSWPEGHWDWPIHLPYKHGIKCGSIVCVGGQVSLSPTAEVIDPGDIPAQTRTSMENIRKVLAGLGAGLDDVVKVTAFYRGAASAEDLHANLRIRSDSFREPGPATTGIPLPYLAYEGMDIEIEAIAMAE